MKLSKRIFAGILSAALVFTAVPAMNASAAKINYSGIYTKEISIEQQDESEAVFNPLLVEVSDGDAENAQSEKVRVMPGMKFAIAATRYGAIIKTSKNKSQFKYKTSNKKVATVTTKGVVTTLKKGKCDITVTNKKDGVKFVLHLTVAKKVKVSSVKLNLKSKKFKTRNYEGKTFQLTAKVKPSKYSNVPILWGSTNTNVATVDERGLVTLQGYGDCQIYCRAGSNNKVASCKVLVIDPDAPKENNNNGSICSLTYNTGKLVDISSHNTVNDWKQLKNSCDGVIIRVGYRGYGSGALVEDSKFRNNVYNCQQYGIPYSFYFFTTAVNEAEGAEEANWIANTISGLNTSMPVFIDVESSGTGSGRSDNMSVAQRTAAVKATVSQLYARGITGGVYSSTWWYNNRLDMSQLQYPLWVADYRGYCGYDQGNKFAWQFTSNGTGYGVANRCDVSEWYQ
ncbi:GH25 family lysozyme [Butyrivibrio sp. INlla16]|uniref:GH25 family lysozyme n=1 Tax=Butyrivibrio sp. INlla16 TaxID=1520807 RepID=UPI00088455BC|nr:GH25 family lysozyme [Butyrivibrio sp. INlla16]SDB40556.1 Ig-like domain (group 2) [Butyrivibrio sp. INlla16]